MTTDDELVDTEPELQHQATCGHPITGCTCSRSHLLGEARRLRERTLGAEAALTHLLHAVTFAGLCASNCKVCRMFAVEAIDRAARDYPAPGFDYRHIELPERNVEVSVDHAVAERAIESGFHVYKDHDRWIVHWNRPARIEGDRWFAGIAVLIGPLADEEASWQHESLSALAGKLTGMFTEVLADTDFVDDHRVQLLAGEIMALPQSSEPISVREILSRAGHYTSTYCMHGDHEHCRLDCKKVEDGHCDRHCNCFCHREVT